MSIAEPAELVVTAHCVDRYRARFGWAPWKEVVSRIRDAASRCRPATPEEAFAVTQGVQHPNRKAELWVDGDFVCVLGPAKDRGKTAVVTCYRAEFLLNLRERTAG